MLMRTDPFREIDRLAEQFFGTAARPAVMHLDAYRDGDHFYAAFDLPGVDPDSIDCTVERNVLTVRAERRRPTGDERRTGRRRTPDGHVHPAAVPRRHPGHRQAGGRLRERGADAAHPGRRARQAPPGDHHRQRRRPQQINA